MDNSSPRTPPPTAVAATSSCDTALRTGVLYKRTVSKLRVVRTSTWLRRVFTLHADGTLSYRVPYSGPLATDASQVSQPAAAATAAAAAAAAAPLGQDDPASVTAAAGTPVTATAIAALLAQPAPSSQTSSSSEDEDASQRLHLFPRGAEPLTRQEQIRLAEALPPGADEISCVFKLRLRGPKPRTLYLCATSPQDAEEWRHEATRASLASMACLPGPALSGIRDHHYFLDLWDAASHAAAHITEANIEKLAKRLGPRTSSFDLRMRLGSISRVNRDHVFYHEFARMEHNLIANDVVKDIVASARGESPRGSSESPIGKSETLDAPHVAKLLSISEEETDKLMKALEIHTCGPVELLHLMCLAGNSVLDPEWSRPTAHDMTQPLSAYYISSSHNTYLVGDQVTSKSSAEMYRLVLEGASRCVEVDLWDGEKEPCVTHGHTLTSAITFRSVLRVIKKHAFVASSYPVIISVECHLSEEMQRLAAENIKTELGDDLFIIPTSDSEFLPSPDALRGKILIKAKKGRWGFPDGRDDDAESSADEEDSGANSEATGSSGDMPSYSKDDAQEITKPPTSPRTLLPFGRARSVMEKLKRVVSGKEDTGKLKLSSRKKDSRPVAKELAEVTSFSGCSRQNVLASWALGQVHPEGQSASDIVSLGESRVAESFSAGFWTNLAEHNVRNLTRVYPKAVRVDSGNYNPMPAWRAGCQLVALNWQTPNLATWLNDGRFIVNGNCGYALKRPPPVRNGAISGAGELELQVLSGFFLPHLNSRMRGPEFADYYVEVSVVGCGEDGFPTIRSKSTPVIKDGFSPSWRETIKLRVEDSEFEMLLLRVYYKDRAARDGVLGFFCSPVYAIRTGIRACHLRGEDGTPLLVPGSSGLRPTVLCKVAWHAAATGRDSR